MEFGRRFINEARETKKEVPNNLRFKKEKQDINLNLIKTKSLEALKSMNEENRKR
jgi:hypothetical protein